MRLKTGEIQRGFLCSHCMRCEDAQPNSPPPVPMGIQHWGSVACFLNSEERRRVGWFLFMKTWVPSLLRLKAEVAKTAAEREGRDWEGGEAGPGPVL